MKEIRRSALVEHSAAEMYRLVDDVESYPQFLPWCRAVQVERIGGKRHATLTVGLGAIRQSFTTVNENQPGEDGKSVERGRFGTAIRSAVCAVSVDAGDEGERVGAILRTRGAREVTRPPR